MELNVAMILSGANENDLKLREQYSGRGMMGAVTAGVVGSMNDLLGAIASKMVGMTEATE